MSTKSTIACVFKIQIINIKSNLSSHQSSRPPHTHTHVEVPYRVGAAATRLRESYRENICAMRNNI